MHDSSSTALDLIHSHISTHGYHLVVVAGTKMLPRYAYTVGLTDSLGAELVFAGGAVFLLDELRRIFKAVLDSGFSGAGSMQEVIVAEGLGAFSFCDVHPSWSESLLLAASDYYNKPAVPAIQIIPDEEHWTIDVPCLGDQWDDMSEPVWRWLHRPWEYPVPPTSMATTNLDALRGYRVTEAVRWEVDGWELFSGAGPEVTEEEMRVVPLGTLLGFDPSLDPVTQLSVDEGVWREGEDDSVWQAWK